MKNIIIQHLNELGSELEKSYGKKLILLEKNDFEDFAERLVKKLNIPVVSIPFSHWENTAKRYNAIPNDWKCFFNDLFNGY